MTEQTSDGTKRDATQDNQTAYGASMGVQLSRRAAHDGLTPAEQTAFSLLEPEHQLSVLDIGIGAGRTINPLRAIFREYTGIDYSAPMIDAARTEFPGVTLLVMDARELNFPRSFDCILFSYNGIDCVNMEDRHRILERVARHLRPGGLFIYSTHNLHFERVPVWMESLLVRELFKPLRRLRFFWQRLFHFYAQSKGEQFAYVNDGALGFSLLLTYVDIPSEIERLRSYNLHAVATIGAIKQESSCDSSEPWVYLVARKDLPRPDFTALRDCASV